MIGSIRGRLMLREADRILVETGGVGYLLHIPFSTFFTLGELGSEVSLQVHTHVREDALQLYGFGSDLELKVFHRLIGVSGVGPRMAINILSGIPAEDLVEALRASDVKRLTQVPGLGKKTSERLVLELKDKLIEIAAGGRDRARTATERELRDDAVSALVNLSYRPRDAEEAVDRVLAKTAPNLEALLKAALAVLAR